MAFWLAVNVELRELVPEPCGVRDPWPRMAHPDVVEFSHHDYGNRVGFWRVVELLDDLGVPCTVSLNAGVVAHFPEIAAEIVDRGWEVMAHGVYNTRYWYTLSEAEERAEIERCRELVRSATGKPPQGMLGPSITSSPRTPDLLAEAGFVYQADWVHDDQPTELGVRTGRLISVPYTYELNDAPLLRGHWEFEELASRTLDQLSCVTDEAGDGAGGRVACVSVHPFLVGQPHRIDAFAELLRQIRDRAVWWTTAGAIAEHYLHSTAEAAR